MVEKSIIHLIMEDFIFRKAKNKDLPFLVETIIESEKSGTNILTYCTIFGLSEGETRKYIAKMLLKRVDGCELSISSFLLAEKEGNIVASVGAWIEGNEGIASNVLKGNLLNLTLPKKCFEHAISLDSIGRELHFECIPNTIQIGLVYVTPAFRGMNLVSLLIDNQIKRLTRHNRNISEIYVQVYGNNIPAIRTYERANFKIQLIKESANEDIINYMPSSKKILMKREFTIV
jgi:ribosomal protein S18 acetylase RimI-like enzyme